MFETAIAAEMLQAWTEEDRNRMKERVAVRPLRFYQHGLIEIIGCKHMLLHKKETVPKDQAETHAREMDADADNASASVREQISVGLSYQVCSNCMPALGNRYIHIF